jgi:uncharacterized protein YigE (DUF2233 family)
MCCLPSKPTYAVIVGLLLTTSPNAAEQSPCRAASFEGHSYTVCEADVRQTSIRLFWKAADGHPYSYLRALPQLPNEHSGPLLLATNAGMFDDRLKPVGLYVENGQELVHINTKPGPGNFHMKPNGVFFATHDRVGVLETRAYLQQRLSSEQATQSGPMLVINGHLHPRFIRSGASRKRRSGVGSRDPHVALFVISDGEVTFHDFARFFRDGLQCSNALFLDGGSVPSVYIPAQNRGGNLLPIGPMIGVFARANGASAR